MAKRQLSMLNFVNDEREKQPKSNGNSKKQKQEGESDKKDEKRKIKSEWFSRFTWLKIREDKFYCEICEQNKKTNIFTYGKPVDQPKKDDFIKHEATKDHRDALKVPELKTNLGKATVNAYHKCQNGVIALMRTIYVMAKENISTRKIKALTELQVLNGCEDLRPLQRMVGTDPDMLSASSSGSATRLPMAYTHHDSIDDIYNTLSDTILSEIISAVKSASYFSIQIDEGTDCSNITTLMMYIRFIDVQGQIQSSFLTVKELAGCSSSEIFDSLKLALDEKGLNIAKMIGFASDGASVMTGVKKGVTALAKDANPFILTVHCLAHRLALASEKAAKQIPYMVKYLEVVNRLGKLCKFSPKFCRLLENSKNINGQSDALKLKQVFFTRWLSFADCVDSLVGCLESLICCLHTTSSDPSHGVTANGILKNVACYKFIATTYFCADLVGILGLLCKCMQKDKLLYADIKSQIDSTIIAIQVLESTDGPHFAEFLKKNSQGPPSEFPMTSSFNNTHDVSDSVKQRADFQSTRKQLVQKIVSNLQSWFPDSELMNAFSVLDPSSSSSEEENFHHLEQLKDHFGSSKKDKQGNNHEAIIDPIKTQVEYSVVKEIMKKNDKNDNMAKFYTENIHNNLNLYPNLGKLYAIALTCPCTSVECERGFSQYNLIKTNHRNLLSVLHVNQLSVISIEGPPVHMFNFEHAFSNWVSKRERKSFHKMYLNLKESQKMKEVQKENKKVQVEKERVNVIHVENERTESENEVEDDLNDDIERRINALSNIVLSLVGNCNRKKMI